MPLAACVSTMRSLMSFVGASPVLGRYGGSQIVLGQAIARKLEIAGVMRTTQRDRQDTAQPVMGPNGIIVDRRIDEPRRGERSGRALLAPHARATSARIRPTCRRK